MWAVLTKHVWVILAGNTILALAREGALPDRPFKEVLSLSHECETGLKMCHPASIDAHKTALRHLKCSLTYWKSNLSKRLGLDLMHQVKATGWYVNINHKISRPPRLCLIFTNRKRLCKAPFNGGKGLTILNLIRSTLDLIYRLGRFLSMLHSPGCDAPPVVLATLGGPHASLKG